MSNHVHLAMVAGPEPLATWLRQVHSTFADTGNRSRERIGALFVRGPEALLVPDDRVGRVIAYLHNNPVRAGVCAQPHDSTWTSHRAQLGLDDAPPWLDVGEGMRRTGLTDVMAFEALAAALAYGPRKVRVQGLAVEVAKALGDNAEERTARVGLVTVLEGRPAGAAQPEGLAKAKAELAAMDQPAAGAPAAGSAAAAAPAAAAATAVAAATLPTTELPRAPTRARPPRKRKPAADPVR